MEAGTWMRTLVGGLAWAGWYFLPEAGGDHAELSGLLIFTMLVLTPSALALARRRSEALTHLFDTARYLQTFAALIAGTSFLIPAGVLAATLAIAWFPVTALLALDAARRLRRLSPLRIAELCVDVGLMYLPIGAFFLWASRMGLPVFGLQEPQLLLAAVHFHLAGFVTAVLAGMAGRALGSANGASGGLFGLTAALVLPGPILLFAAGLFPEGPGLLLALILAAGHLGLALLSLTGAARQISAGAPRNLLRLSALSLAAVAILGVGFAAADASRWVFVSVPAMVNTQGWLLAAGFSACGLLAWGLHRMKAPETGGSSEL